LGLNVLSPPLPFFSLFSFFFSFPLAQERKGGPLLSCVVLSPSPLFSTCLGLGISYGGLSFCTGIQREWRPHPPLVLRALDFDSILFRCWILVSLCCVAVQGRLCVLALMLEGERQQAWQAQGVRLALTAVVWQVAVPAATPRRAAGSGKQ